MQWSDFHADLVTTGFGSQLGCTLVTYVGPNILGLACTFPKQWKRKAWWDWCKFSGRTASVLKIGFLRPLQLASDRAQDWKSIIVLPFSMPTLISMTKTKLEEQKLWFLILVLQMSTMNTTQCPPRFPIFIYLTSNLGNLPRSGFFQVFKPICNSTNSIIHLHVFF